MSEVASAPTAPDGTPERTPSTGWGAAIVHLAGGVDSILSRADRRQIQTMRYDRWDTGMIWRCLHQFVFPHLRELRLNPDQVDENEQRWAALIIAMSWCPHTRTETSLRLGAALGRCKYQEPRLTSLLRCTAHDPALYDRFIHAIRFIGQKDAPLDWRDASRLIFTLDDEKRERVRRDIARDYYREKSFQS